MSKKSIIWTAIFGLSCFFGIGFCFLGLQYYPFSKIYALNIILIFALLGVAVVSRMKIHRYVKGM